jgi:hypothetical protein
MEEFEGFGWIQGWRLGGYLPQAKGGKKNIKKSGKRLPAL